MVQCPSLMEERKTPATALWAIAGVWMESVALLFVHPVAVLKTPRLREGFCGKMAQRVALGILEVEPVAEGGVEKECFHGAVFSV